MDHRYIEDRITDLENQFRDLKSGLELQSAEEQRRHEEMQHALEAQFQSFAAMLETKASQEEFSELVDVVAGKASTDHVGRVDAALDKHRAEAERHRTEIHGKMAETAGHQQERHAEALGLLESHCGNLQSTISSTAAEHSKELELRMGDHGAKLEAHRSELHGRICEAAAEQQRLADMLAEVLESMRELSESMATKASQEELSELVDVVSGKASTDHVGRVDAALGEHRAEAERHRTEIHGKMAESLDEHRTDAERHRTEIHGKMAETAGHHQARHAEALGLLDSHRGDLESRISSKAAEHSKELESRMGDHGAKLEAHRSELHGRICEAAAEQQRLADMLAELLEARRVLSESMATKASIDHLQAVSVEVASKASSAEFQDLHMSVDSKVSKAAFQELSAMMGRLATSEQFQELAVMTGEQLEELSGAVENKAEAADLGEVTDILAKKASRHELEVLIASHREQSFASASRLDKVTADLDLKADMTFVSAGLELKADKTFVVAGLDPKADKTWVDELLAKRDDLTQVRRAVAVARRESTTEDEKDGWHRDL